MPNELKNALNASTHLSETQKTSRIGSSSVTMMIWTISGIVLAACNGGMRVVTRDGRGTEIVTVPGGGSGGPVVRVIDGPVKGAAVYFDLNGDGQVSAEEKAAQTDASGRPFYVTNERGEAQIPEAYEGVRFVAEVTGAYDTATGERLSGEYQSLAGGGIATPLTDLLNQVERDGGSAQGALDQVFGMDADGESQVTVADILNYENYGILSTAPSIMTKPTAPVESTFTGGATDTPSLLLAQAAYQQALLQYQADLAAYNANLANMIIDMITRASIAITEIDQDTTLLTSGGATDTAENRVALLETLFDGDSTNDNAALTQLLNDRVRDGRQILDGKPVAAPDPYVTIDEDHEFNITDYTYSGSDDRSNIEGFFGFVDPGQNAANEVISSFRGIYIKASVDNAQLLFNGNPLTSPLTTQGDNAPPNTPSETGFFYVSYGHLAGLSINPNANFHGILELEYYVFDGIDFSNKATLEINVRSVNDAPVFTGLSGDRDPVQTDAVTQYVLSTDGQVILSDGSIAGLIEGLNDVEDANDDLVFTIGGPDGDLFEIAGDNATGFTLKLKDDATPKNAGETYQITITVTDTEGLSSDTLSFDITQGGFYLENAGVRTYSNGAALIDEEADGSSTPVQLGTIGVEGLETAEQGTAGSEGYKSAITFSTNTDGFDIVNGVLRYVGNDSGDYETGDSLSVTVSAEYHTTVVQAEDFVGQKGAQIDGDSGNANTETFSYSGLAVSFETRGDFDENDNAFASVNIGSGVIYVSDNGPNSPAKTITISEDVQGLTYSENGFIIVSGEGEVSFVAALPNEGEYYVIAKVSEPDVIAGTPLIEGSGTHFITAYTDSVTPVTVYIDFAPHGGGDAAPIVSQDVGADCSLSL